MGDTFKALKFERKKNGYENGLIEAQILPSNVASDQYLLSFDAEDSASTHHT